MRMTLLVRPALTLFALGFTGMPAQVVVSGGGTNLQAAVNAASDGDVLLVQPGTYSGFTTGGKGLTVLASGQVRISGRVEITQTTAQQSWTVRGLEWPTAHANGFGMIRLDQCAGPILLEQIVQPPSYVSAFPPVTGVWATACDRVVLRDCTIECTASLSDGHYVIQNSTVRGEDARLTANQASFLFPRTALGLTFASVDITGGCIIEGGDGRLTGMFATSDRPAISMAATDLRLLGGTLASGQMTPVGAWAQPAVRATSGTVRVTGRVTLNAPGAPIEGAVVSSGPMPELAGSSAPIAGNLAATATTEVGDLVILAVGLPAAAAFVPGITDPFWIDPGAHVFAAIGVQQSGIPITANVQVPANPALRGATLSWGAACQGPATGLQATNPTLTTVF